MTALSGLLKNLFKALPALLLLGSCVLYAADGDSTGGNGNNDNSGNESGQPVPASDAALPAAATESTAETNSDNPPAEDQNQPVKQLPRVVPNTDASRHYGLLQYLRLHSRESELVRLVAAESEFYGLLLTETRGQPQGGVLILHDNGQHGHWPEIVAPLREALPAYGWTTLSIELPEQPTAQPPARTSTAEYTAATTPDATETPEAAPADTGAAAEAAPPAETPAADSVDNNGISAVEKTTSDGQDNAFNAAEPALPRLSELPPLPPGEPEPAPPAAEQADINERYREQMQDRIRQGISFLNQRGQLNIVVIACGNSANWAADFLLARSQNGSATKPAGNTANQDKAQERGLALILIDALDNPLSAVPLNQQLGQLDLPLLDLISEQSISPAYANQQRAGNMRHKQRRQYQQIEIPAFDLNYDDSNLIVRRVRGWLKTNAAGTELPNRKVSAN
ncbi:alpha/beta hydrolase family protein [Thalassolituus hydrocarboniclasticus]|uniref:DUF3530 family protein n=1 Tax=Thalassolituus hydrocarboniclasticus TaxID=2742796 RepID=A0ABY6A6X7_9GAMM|nr:alpha/beta hydrolase family protein [Thalassolituus hydrocarboniclasticus]UXD86692.1 DUF3530 family protein [Thalassolituus hydrocarboniclasticus]